jgi:PIN domain nuclease of toxin-antitoxin system
MRDVQNELFVSIASLWEIGIKVSINKLTLPVPIETVIPHNLQLASIRTLEVRFEHVAAGCKLPFHHKDPFDRMLAAQYRGEAANT